MSPPERTQATMRALRLPPAAMAAPEEICRELLTSLFNAAINVELICTGVEPKELARLTLGFASLLRDDVSLVVVMISDEEDELAQEELERRWSDAVQCKATTERLSIYRYFADRQRLRVFVRSPADFGPRCLIRDQLAEGSGILLVSDAETTIEILWREAFQLAKQTAVAASLKWSFGDPARCVDRLRASIQQALGREGPAGALQLEKVLEDHIRGLPPLSLPWQETFAGADLPRTRLHPHQEAVIGAWLENGGRGIFKMCTGAGKTIAALAAARLLSQRETDFGRRTPPVIVTVPTRILADQWIREIKRHGFAPPLDAYHSAEHWQQTLEPLLKVDLGEGPQFVVSTYRTFADARFQAKLRHVAAAGVQALWIADESHNLSSSRLMDVMQGSGPLFRYRLGLSATPEVEGNPTATERIFAFFGGILKPVYELADGIRDGVLCRYRYYPVPAYLAPTAGERYLNLLQSIDSTAPGSPSLINLYRESRELLRTSGVQVAAFENLLGTIIQKRVNLAHTLVYCPPGYGVYGDENSDEIDQDQDECRLLEQVVQTVRTHGVSPVSILGETSLADRRVRLDLFAQGRAQVLCAIGCLDEGVDVPSIQRALVLYSVDRERQFVQRRGRILRKPAGGGDKIAEIYDILVLPQGSSMPAAQADLLLRKELRRYRTFAELALNRAEAEEQIQLALTAAVGPVSSS